MQLLSMSEHSAGESERNLLELKPWPRPMEVDAMARPGDNPRVDGRRTLASSGKSLDLNIIDGPQAVTFALPVMDRYFDRPQNLFGLARPSDRDVHQLLNGRGRIRHAASLERYRLITASWSEHLDVLHNRRPVDERSRRKFWGASTR